MLNRTALIVDDSRTACQVLRLMLEREDFQVATCTSAEEALEHLGDHRPGIIFMDHMMPGMDGFQAVKEIKANPAIAAIPIVMYTARSGDVYVGQAHALGAVDILSKPPTRESLRAVFRRIDERGAEAEALEVVAEMPDETSPEAEPPALRVEPIAATSAPTGASERPAPARKPTAVRERPAFEAQPSRARVPWWAALAFGVLAFVAGARVGDDARQGRAQFEALSWALADGVPYAFGEAPFGGERLRRIEELLGHLRAAGYRGVVRVRGHAGQFCLVAQGDGWAVADPGLPIEECATIGLDPVATRLGSGRQSPEFREFLWRSPLLGRSGIRLQVDAAGDSEPLQPYPAPGRVRTAGDWNRVAALNNRLSVELVPDG